MQLNNQRQNRRVDVSIDVDLVHPVNSQKARIIDLSLGGAKLAVTSAPKAGSKVVIDYEGYSAWASVRWSEQDRIGVVFEVPLADDHPFHKLIGRTVAPIITASQTRHGLRTPSFGRRAA